MIPILLGEIKNIMLSFLKDEDIKIVLFGSRAREDWTISSDIDIGIIPQSKFNRDKLTLLREALENTNIPYKIELVDLSLVSEAFKEEVFKRAIIWKD